MNFWDVSGGQIGSATELMASTVATMLIACAEEASRMAEALARLDGALSHLTFPSGKVPLALQEIDLLRQEGAGLASILGMIATDPEPSRRLDPVTVASALAVWAQCARLHATAQAVRLGSEIGES